MAKMPNPSALKLRTPKKIPNDRKWTPAKRPAKVKSDRGEFGMK